MGVRPLPVQLGSYQGVFPGLQPLLRLSNLTGGTRQGLCGTSGNSFLSWRCPQMGFQLRTCTGCHGCGKARPQFLVAGRNKELEGLRQTLSNIFLSLSATLLCRGAENSESCGK